MKISRFIAMAVIALMVVAGLGFMTVRSFAQTTQPAVRAQATAQATQDTNSNQGNQQGDQTGGQEAAAPAGSATEPAAGATEAPGAAEAAGAADPAGGQNEQSPRYTGSITVTAPANGTNLSETAEAAALASQAKITADQANAAALAANPGTTVVKTELGDENGTLIYSVELSNGSDVKVDAGNAAILATDKSGE